MHSNRIEAMRYLAKNLRQEGHVSRADAVTELSNTVEHVQGLLAKAARVSGELPTALGLEIAEALDGFREPAAADGSCAEDRPPVMDPARDDVLYP